MGKKDQELNKKLSQLSKVANSKNLLVKANPQYVGNKKTHDQLLDEIVKVKRKTDVNGFSNDLIIEKLEKDVLKMRK